MPGAPRGARVGLGLRLRDDRNLDLGCFALYRYGFLRFLQSLDVTLDSILGYGSRVLQVPAFGYEAGQ